MLSYRTSLCGHHKNDLPVKVTNCDRPGCKSQVFFKSRTTKFHIRSEQISVRVLNPKSTHQTNGHHLHSIVRSLIGFLKCSNRSSNSAISCSTSVCSGPSGSVGNRPSQSAKNAFNPSQRYGSKKVTFFMEFLSTSLRWCGVLTGQREHLLSMSTTRYHVFLTRRASRAVAIHQTPNWLASDNKWTQTTLSS